MSKITNHEPLVPGDQISDIIWRSSKCLDIIYLILAWTTHKYVVKMSSLGPQKSTELDDYVLRLFSFWAYPWRIILSDIGLSKSITSLFP